jgi:hypothetical protein
MKHDLQAFSYEIVALIKAGGAPVAVGTTARSSCSTMSFPSPLAKRPCPQSKTSGDGTLHRVGTEKTSNSSRLREASPMSPLPPLILQRAEQ